MSNEFYDSHANGHNGEESEQGTRLVDSNLAATFLCDSQGELLMWDTTNSRICQVISHNNYRKYAAT